MDLANMHITVDSNFNLFIKYHYLDDIVLCCMDSGWCVWHILLRKNIDLSSLCLVPAVLRAPVITPDNYFSRKFFLIVPDRHYIIGR